MALVVFGCSIAVTRPVTVTPVTDLTPIGVTPISVFTPVTVFTPVGVTSVGVRTPVAVFAHGAVTAPIFTLLLLRVHYRVLHLGTMGDCQVVVPAEVALVFAA